MTELQITTIKCAYADLVGAYQSYDSLDIHSHDWKSHLLTIQEMEREFDFITSMDNEQESNGGLHLTCTCGSIHKEHEDLWVAFMEGNIVRNEYGSIELYHTHEEALLNTSGNETPLKVNQTTLEIQNEIKRKIKKQHTIQLNTTHE